MTSPRYYFAYGSNLNHDDRRASGIEDAWLRVVGKAFLPDRELGFTRFSDGRGGGVLDAVHAPGCVLEGVVYEVLDERAWRELDKKEGVKVRAYRRFPTLALRHDGSAIPVTSYEVVEPRWSFPPAETYLAIVRAGFEARGLSLLPLLAAARGEHAEPLTSFFTYGTLMRREVRASCFPARALRCALLAETYGVLLDCGAYPAMVPGGDRLVQGDFFALHSDDAFEGLLQALDAVEGFRGFGKDGSLFERRLLDVGIGDGRVRSAWVYVMPVVPNDATKIPSGDWRAHRRVRQQICDQIVSERCHHVDELVVARKLVEHAAFGDIDDAECTRRARALLPLEDALFRGDISERQLARARADLSVFVGAPPFDDGE